MNNITIEILQGISELIDEFLEPVSYQGLKRRAFGSGYSSRQLRNNFGSLEQRGYIHVDKINNSIILTNKGRIKLIESSSDRTRDGKWRMISYDIPEPLKRKRLQLRRSLNRIGFKQLQKSLWACPFNKADEIDLIVKELGLEKYIAFLLVEKTDIENHLKRLFQKDQTASNS